jgi:two-component system, NarL family, sensor histidine kinase NreB
VSFIPQSSRQAFHTLLYQVSQTGENQSWEMHLRPFQGLPIEVIFQIGVIRFSGEQQTLSCLIHNVTELKRTQRELQAVSQDLMRAAETERAAISRELHEDFGQTLIALKLLLEAIPNFDLTTQFEDAQALIAHLVAQVRSTALKLRPPMLDDFGLLETFIWHFDTFTTQTGITIQFIHPAIVQRFHSDIEIAAYRIVQAALTNVARYAGVTEATVRVWFNKSWLYIQISDKGLGFDLLQVRTGREALGLVSMRERALLAGGQLTIDTAPNSGTAITVKLPRRNRV